MAFIWIDALEHRFEICLLYFRLLSKVTPNTLILSEDGIVFPSILKEQSLFSNVKCKYVTNDKHQLVDLGAGSMFYMVRFEGDAMALSYLSTPYKRTDDMCIELFYWGRGNNQLAVYTRGEDFKPRLKASGVRIYAHAIKWNEIPPHWLISNSGSNHICESNFIHIDYHIMSRYTTKPLL